MIESFKHKGLQELFEKGKTARLPQDRLPKLKKLLAMIHSAKEKKDLNFPGLRLHNLKPPLKGFLSLDVTANYRLVFRFENGIVKDLDYVDTH